MHRKRTETSNERRKEPARRRAGKVEEFNGFERRFTSRREFTGHHSRTSVDKENWIIP